MSNYQTGEYAEMVSSGANYPRSHVVRVVAGEYMEGMDDSPSLGTAPDGSYRLLAEDRRLISEMMTRDGLNIDLLGAGWAGDARVAEIDLLNDIAAYIVATAIEMAGD